MAWRFNDPIHLTLSRYEAREVHEALRSFLDQWPDADSYVHDVIDRMMKQIEHKPAASQQEKP